MGERSVIRWRPIRTEKCDGSRVLVGQFDQGDVLVLRLYKNGDLKLAGMLPDGEEPGPVLSGIARLRATQESVRVG